MVKNIQSHWDRYAEVPLYVKNEWFHTYTKANAIYQGHLALVFCSNLSPMAIVKLSTFFVADLRIDIQLVVPWKSDPNHHKLLLLLHLTFQHQAPY